jgi:hypothetical protein
VMPAITTRLTTYVRMGRYLSSQTS